MKESLNYVEVPLTRDDDANKGKTTWRDDKLVLVDEGSRHVTVYIGHVKATVPEPGPDGHVSEREAMAAFPVRVDKPLTREGLINAAVMSAYGLSSAADSASLNAELSRKWRENINDPDVAEHDEFVRWVSDEVDKTGLFAHRVPEVDVSLPTMSDLLELGRSLARSAGTVMTDVQKAKVCRFFPSWEELVKNGEQLPAGTGLQYGGEYYKVIQEHVPQADWKPSEQHALYAYVSSHDGTHDDPIPYRHWMLLEQGKYYTEQGALYLCTQSLPTGYDSDLAGLSQFAFRV